MDLSIVIVNYNVKHFLEQCLHSVKKAIEEIEAEVFVVDNNSVDGSVAHIRERFPWVRLIENQENAGFSRANNQAIRASSGRYILLLNPDTVVEEDTFSKAVGFMDEHPDAGGLGVKMIDGRGRFLPESKRALPTPRVAFFKVFGLSSLFPKSKLFGTYHLGYLDRDKTHPVDVLAGACMFLRRETLDKTGLLDEDYFMYGEDIDLSYRITRAGYRNYYYPGTTIIHYKGESTKKGSLNYVLVFYNAMIIFARKHFSSANARAYSTVINGAIYLRAFMALLRRFVKRIYRPVIDALLIFAGYLAGLPLWEQFTFGRVDYYPDTFVHFVVPAYILIWIITVFYSGGYEKPLHLWRLWRGLLVGTGVILVIYALLPEHWRFSRALILLGFGWAALITTLLRVAMHLAGIPDYELELNKKKRMVIVGEPEEAERVHQLLTNTQIRPETVGFVYPGNEAPHHYLGTIEQAEEIVRIHRLDEIIFCARDIPSQQIIGVMTRLTGVNVDYKIAPPERLSIIGSNSINTAGELYTIHFNTVARESNRRAKRLFDLVSSTLLILTVPAWLPFVPRPLRALGKTFRVLFGLNTWVGYYKGESFDPGALPPLRPGILHPAIVMKEERMDPEAAHRLNLVYAKDYKLGNDIGLLWRGFKTIGRHPS